MEVIKLIEKYYEPGSNAFRFLLRHSELVAEKALQVARRVRELSPDMVFIEEAAMLHDIGIFMTNAPKIGCYGHHPYISHGFLGRELLESEGLLRHALVCERHVGVGITAAEIAARGLPLPARDMVPLTIEEEIVCYADKFFSKNGKKGGLRKSPEEVERELAGWGLARLPVFSEWRRRFGDPP